MKPTDAFPRKPRMPTARYVLKRVAFHALKEGHLKNPPVKWDDLIDDAAEALADSLEHAEIISDRTCALLVRIEAEWTQVNLGARPSDEDLIFTILVEGN